MPARKSSRIEFTKTVIEALPVPSTGRVYVHDTRVPSLAVCITANGAKTFYRTGRVRHRPVRVRLGRFPDLPVAKARELAADLSLQVASGRNIVATRRNETRTLESLWIWYLAHHAKPNKRTWARDEARWHTHLAHLGTKRIGELQRSDILELMSDVKREHGPYAANHCLEQLRHMLSLAVENDWLPANPATGIKRFPRPPRERFLSDTELPRFLSAVEQIHSETARDFIMLALFTGARRSNVGSMRWEELDLDTGLWTVPAAKYKGKVDATLILPPQAVEILRRRLNKSPWVFPTWSKSGHYEWPKDAWTRVLKLAGLSNLRLHDLRHTLASWQLKLGSPLPIIGKSLGHKNLSSTARYSHSDSSQVQKSVADAVDAMVNTRQKKF